MSKRKRVNKDTGKLEYKARYFWIDENGKKKDSDTGWFPSKAEAYIEAERLRKEKSSGAIQKKTEQLNNSIEETFGEWIAYLNEKMSNDTDGTYYLSIRNKARSLIKHHTPEEIKNTKIKNMTLNTFRIWVNWVNDEDIAGKTVRGFKQTMRYFNKYLDSNGLYMDDNMFNTIDVSLFMTNVKNNSIGARKRYAPTIADIKKITDGYMVNDGFGKFESFYWYTLFLVLFYTGMRVEELIGLQWKYVDLYSEDPCIEIVNSINERENPKNVMARIRSEHGKTKTFDSKRTIYIFEYYGSVLEQYAKRFKEEFDLDDDEFEESFVFPNVTARDPENRLDYQKHKNILRQLDTACKIAGVPKTDSQMFRHGCAIWLITPKKNGGLGYKREDVYQFFGHSNARMVDEVYARMNKEQRDEKTKAIFEPITKKNKTGKGKRDQKLDEIRNVNKKIIDPVANEEEKYYAIYNRVHDEILQAIKDGKKEYTYTLAEQLQIDEILSYYASRGRDLESEITFYVRQTPKDIELLEQYMNAKGQFI